MRNGPSWSVSRDNHGSGENWAAEVVTLFDVLDEAGVGGLPAQELLGNGAGGGHVGAEQVHEHALVLRHRDPRRVPITALAEGLSGPSLADYASVKAPAGRPYERPHPAKRPGRGVRPGR